jgi:hypothetical protein
MWGSVRNAIHAGTGRFLTKAEPALAFASIPVDGKEGESRGALILIKRPNGQKNTWDFDQIQQEALTDIAKAMGLALTTQHALLRKLGAATRLGAITVAGRAKRHDLVEKASWMLHDVEKLKRDPRQDPRVFAAYWPEIHESYQLLLKTILEGAISLKAEQCCLRQVIGNAVALVERELSGSKVLIKEIQPAPIRVIEWYFSAALRNLLVNSMEAIKDDAGSGELRLSSFVRDGYAFISIENTGRTYTVEEIDGFFVPGRTRKKNHLGMGLNLAQQIIEQEHGKLALRPRAGGGVEAIVSLPCDDSPTANE